MLARLQAKNGIHTIDNNLQSTVPGLYLTSITATGDFGPFFGFRSRSDLREASRTGLVSRL